jgi:iron complex outermembrane recepter protein
MMKKLFFIWALTFGISFFLNDIPLAGAAEGGDDEFTLEEITVTASKRAENQQKVAIAMEVITGEELATKGKINIDDILKDVSNVSVQSTPTGMRVSMRGITDDGGEMNGQHTSGSTVAVNVDGTYNNNQNAGSNLFDVERVEVLFGPQSTLYGSNSPGGIVNVITAAPKTDRFSVSGSQELGTYKLQNTQVAVNVPVIQEKFALRLAASRNVRDSYVQSGVEATNTKSARLKALWNVYDKLSVTVTGNWNKNINGGGQAGSVRLFDKPDGNWYTVTTVGGPGGQTVYTRGAKVTDPWTWDGNGVGNSFDQVTKALNGEINWKTSFANISAVPSYNKTTSTGHGSQTTPQGVLREYDQGRGNTQKGAEVRMTNTEDFTLFQWILGGTYYKSVQSSYQIYTFSSDGSAVAPNTQDTTQSKKAIYGNITYPLWFYDSVRVTAGYRKSWDESNTVAPGPGSTVLTTSGAKPYSKPDIKFGFEYDVNKDMMAFGTYATSYRSGNGMAMPNAAGKYPANEELKATTIGLKSRWLDNKLQVNASVFFYNYKNKLASGFMAAYGLTETAFGYDAISAVRNNRGQYAVTLAPDGQYPTMNPTNPSQVWTFQLNDPNSQGTGDFKSKGLDLQVAYILTSADRLNFSASYLDEVWKTLHFRYYWYMIFPDGDYAGVTPANAPKLSMTASYEHNFMLGNFGILTPRIDLQRKSKYKLAADPTNPDPIGFGNQDAYFKGDLSAAYSANSGKWTLNAYCKNFTNEAVKTTYMSFGGSYRMSLTDPRTYGATLSVKF